MHDHLLSSHLLFTHLQSVSFTASLTCYPLICYQFTYYLFHLLSASLVLRPHFHSNLTCFGHTCYSASLAIRSISYQASLAIPLFAINSLAICFTCSRPLLYSGLTCSRRTRYPASLCCQVNLQSGLTCYQNVCSRVSTTNNAHLLSEYLAIKIRCFLNKLQSEPVLSCYYKQLLLFKQVAIKTSSYLLSKTCCFLNKLLSKPVFICYHKLVAFSISGYQNQFLFAIINLLLSQ